MNINSFTVELILPATHWFSLLFIHSLGSDPDELVFDGVVLPRTNSDIWRFYVAHLPPARYERTPGTNQEYAAGVRAMLPNWTEEIEKGSSISDLCKWLERARAQQSSLLTGFNNKTSKTSWVFDNAERIFDQVLMCCKW